MPDGISAIPSVVERHEIRVFISSTFRDMQEEREELVKQIFPQLRRLCESRGVTWGEVDLRWGVPDEAKAEGKVLPLCLAEIEHCRPYFIGLLGERYGWVPEEIPQELLDAQPWLNEHRKQSVTALEILHGVLRNPQMAEHAFFYFRDPAYAAAHTGFTEEDADRRERLAELKDAIRKSGFPVKENFATPKQLGEWVLRDITAVIESLYPEKSVPDLLDRDAADHEAYATSRRSVYIGRKENIERLDAHAAGDGPPLVVLGESGGGKSALLANWTYRWSEEHPETPVLVHFIGAAPDSVNWMAMLRRLLGEFRRKFGIQIEIPDQPDALRMAFANALHMVAAHRHVVLVLDALNQIEDRDGAPDLVWLPPAIPANVRMVVSTLPGQPLDDLKKRGWPVLGVEPLTTPERKELIVKYLNRYSKALSPRTVHCIAVAPQTGNGLYLCTLLNELRQFGSYESLNERIDWYLQAASPVELYSKVIERWEQDYGKPDPACENVVRESMVRLWAARRGLSETELLDSLGTEGSPLPRAVWSPLYLAAGDALVNRGGLLTFAHDFLREAVREAYLPTTEDKQSTHRTLANYFHDQPQGPRQLDELPWQWQESAEWQNLADLLTQLGFFGALWEKDEFEVKAYWAQIENHSQLRIREAYGRVVTGQTGSPSHMLRVSTLFDDTGHKEEAFSVRNDLVTHYQQTGNRPRLAVALGAQAVSLQNRGQLEEAMAMHREEEGIYRELNDRRGLSRSLCNQSSILGLTGDLHSAMTLARDAEQISRRAGDKEILQASLSRQGTILGTWGKLDEAMALYKEGERICRELGDKGGLCGSIGKQAAILKDKGDLAGSISLLKEQAIISRELGDKGMLSASLGGQAMALYALGEVDAAIALMNESIQICRGLGNPGALAISLGNLAVALKNLGRLDEALALHREEEKICRELGYKSALTNCLGNLGVILKNRGDLIGATALLKEQEVICRELGDEAALSGCLLNQANVLLVQGNEDVAFGLYKKAEEIFRELGNESGLSLSLGNEAVILRNRGDLDGSMALLREQERICRALGNKAGLTLSLGNQAVILRMRGDLDGAMALHKEEECICRELGDQARLSFSLGNQGLIWGTRGELDKAMALLEEEERICRQLGRMRELANSLLIQAVISARQPAREARAVPLLKEASTIAKRIGFRALQKEIEQILGPGGTEGRSRSGAPAKSQVSYPPHDANAIGYLRGNYGRDVARWKALPWWKRLMSRKPEPPNPDYS
jgi:tetratricopeptide (TPR) repeat protein